MRATVVIAASALLASAAVAEARPAPARCGEKVAKQVRARTSLCLTRSAPKARRPPSRDTSAGGGPLRDGGATPQAPGATTPAGGSGGGSSAPPSGGSTSGGQTGDSGGAPELNALGVRAYDRSGVFTFETTRSTVRPGVLTVSFRNYDSDEHNLWIEGTSPFVGAVRLVDDLAGGGDATTTTSLSAGAYRLFCTVPGHSSMTKTLTVSG